MFTDHRCSTHQPCLYSTRQSLVFVRSFISPVHHILWPPFQHSVRLRPSSPTFPSSPIDIPAFVLISIIDLLQMDLRSNVGRYSLSDRATWEQRSGTTPAAHRSWRLCGANFRSAGRRRCPL